LILPQAVLDAPRLGCLNVHASLLPRWRGAAPIQRAIEAGDQVTGVTIMQMDAGLDTGAMLATAECAIGGQTTAAALHDQLAELGAPLLLTVLDKLQEYQRNGVRQNDARSSYAGKISKAEAEIDWRRDAVELDRAIRAFNPFPVCYSFLGGERIKLWQAMPAATITAPEAPGTLLRADREGILVSCGRGLLLVQQLQLPGGRVLTAEQLLNANSALFAPGNQFTLPGAGTS
jgi:methionyl-tRNA formyltransferase